MRKRKRSMSKETGTAAGTDDSKVPSPPSPTYQIVNVRQWLNGWHCNAPVYEVGDGSNKTLPLVDLRSSEEFDAFHLSDHRATPFTAEDKQHTSVPVVNLPLQSLLSGERSCELPPRNVEFAILIPRENAAAFREREECCIHQLFFASQSKSTMQSRKPWLVRQVLVDGESLWKEADECKLVQRNSAGSDCTLSFRSLPRLWKPDPLVSSDILPLLKDWIADTSSKNGEVSSVDKPVGLVLDLGSGAGRDICFLAEEMKEFQQQIRRSKSTKRTIRFIGIDNHKGSAKRCLPMWKNRGVADVANSCLLDLNKLHSVRNHFTDHSKLRSETAKQSSILCVFAIRFLNRRLLSYIANSLTDGMSEATEQSSASHPSTKGAIHSPPSPLVLPTGTLMAVSHFCKPEEGASWNFDHPKESSVLERQELKNLFGDAMSENINGDVIPRWQILKDDIVSDGDHGRTLIQFLAKRVA